jgi:hypothetical protein
MGGHQRPLVPPEQIGRGSDWREAVVGTMEGTRTVQRGIIEGSRELPVLVGVLAHTLPHVRVLVYLSLPGQTQTCLLFFFELSLPPRWVTNSPVLTKNIFVYVLVRVLYCMYDCTVLTYCSVLHRDPTRLGMQQRPTPLAHLHIKHQLVHGGRPAGAISNPHRGIWGPRSWVVTRGSYSGRVLPVNVIADLRPSRSASDVH